MSGLDLTPALDRPELLAPAVEQALRTLAAVDPVAAASVLVAPIDPDLADTAAFCAAYGVEPGESANCVVLAGRRGEVERLAAALVLATTRVDVNRVARREMDVRKASFADRDAAVAASGMEFGGITPVGLPAAWPLLLDPAVVALTSVVVGSGIRGSKLRLPGAVLAGLPGARVVPGLGRPIAG